LERGEKPKYGGSEGLGAGGASGPERQIAMGGEASKDPPLPRETQAKPRRKISHSSLAGGDRKPEVRTKGRARELCQKGLEGGTWKKLE